MKNKRIVWIGAGIVLIAAVALFMNHNASGVNIKISKAVIGDIAPAVSVSGEIKGSNASLSPKLIGIVSWIGVKEGDHVNTGRLLAKLDNYDAAYADYIRTKELYNSGYATKQQFEQAKLQYESSCFISPINGAVSMIANKVGESVSPGMTFMSIVDKGSAYAEVQIDESDIGEVKVGQDVSLFADAYPEKTFKGRLVNIGQEAELKKVGGRVKMDEEDKIFRGRVSLSDPEYSLKIGMSVNADIITDRKTGLVIIPREAVSTKDEKQAVFLVNKNKVKEVKVILGPKDASNISVTKGVVSGDAVAVSNLEKLKDGAAVKIEKD